MRKGFVVRGLRISALIALSLSAVNLFAQSDVGTITGFVLDPTTAGVTNATVTMKNEAINEEHKVATDALGHYTVPNLLPGLYTMTAEAPGLRSSKAHTIS